MGLQLIRALVFLGLATVSGTLTASTNQDNGSVLVSVVNDAGVDDGAIMTAEETASRIYHDAGLAIIWKNCRIPRGNDNARCIQAVDARHLVLRIEHQPKTLGMDIYGVAFLDADGNGAYCDVFYDRILSLHHQGRASVGIILGIVSAHELGHLLLGSDAHSSAGLMRPQLLAKDFSSPELGLTTFSGKQAQKIADRLGAREPPKNRDGNPVLRVKNGGVAPEEKIALR